MSKFDHVLGVVSQTKVFGGNRTHDSHAHSLAHRPQDYNGTLFLNIEQQLQQFKVARSARLATPTVCVVKFKNIFIFSAFLSDVFLI